MVDNEFPMRRGERVVGIDAFTSKPMYLPHSPAILSLLPSDAGGLLLPADVCVDGWCIWSAVRLLADVAGVHSADMVYLPLYLPPGATKQAPYGLAGLDCPDYVLGRSKDAMKPKYLLRAGLTIREAFATLCDEATN